ncbi:MAG: histone deacetylase [Deltaproteobacteria bacterium SG8_13]|nr:MAG: histone deacetylase [Deltaproteobacteria bacterium SG8_13]
MTRTGIVWDPRYLNHRTSNGHPESRKRLMAIYAMLEQMQARQHFVEIPPRKASEEEILLVHSPEYHRKIAATDGLESVSLTGDTHTSADSYQTACLAAGGLLEAVSMVSSGKIDNAFALVRPPGHHAEKSRAMGYCLFNNVALAAAFARKKLGMERILIVDWDVHHGNGTQHLFERDPSVLFFSIHQYPHFPGTGFFTETGIGPGEGFTVNLPIPRGYGDGEYVAILSAILPPLAAEFRPDLVLVSAGFDMHPEDPLGGMQVSPRGFSGMTRCIMNLADACCGGRLVLALEGGYCVDAIGESVKAVLMELADFTFCSPSELAAQARPKKVLYALKRSVKVQRHYWKSLAEPLQIQFTNETLRI